MLIQLDYLSSTSRKVVPDQLKLREECLRSETVSSRSNNQLEDYPHDSSLNTLTNSSSTNSVSLNTHHPQPSSSINNQIQLNHHSSNPINQPNHKNFTESSNHHPNNSNKHINFTSKLLAHRQSRHNLRSSNHKPNPDNTHQPTTLNPDQPNSSTTFQSKSSENLGKVNPSKLTVVRSKTRSILKSLSFVSQSHPSDQSNPTTTTNQPVTRSIEPVNHQNPSKKKPDPLTRQAIGSLNHTSTNQSLLYSCPRKGLNPSSGNRSSSNKLFSVFKSSLSNSKHYRPPGSSRSTKRQSTEIDVDSSVDCHPSTQSPLSTSIQSAKIGRRLSSYPGVLERVPDVDGKRVRSVSQLRQEPEVEERFEASRPRQRTPPVNPGERLLPKRSSIFVRCGSSLKVAWLDSTLRANSANNDLSKLSEVVTNHEPLSELASFSKSVGEESSTRDDLYDSVVDFRCSSNSPHQTISLPSHSVLPSRQSSQPGCSGRVSPTELALQRLTEILNGNQPKEGLVVANTRQNSHSLRPESVQRLSQFTRASTEGREEGEEDEGGNDDDIVSEGRCGDGEEEITFKLAKTLNDTRNYQTWAYAQAPGFNRTKDNTQTIALRPPPSHRARLSNQRKSVKLQKSGNNELEQSQHSRMNEQSNFPSTPGLTPSSSCGTTSSPHSINTNLPAALFFEAGSEFDENNKEFKTMEMTECEEFGSKSYEGGKVENCLNKREDDELSGSYDKVLDEGNDGRIRTEVRSRHVKIRPEVWQNISISASKNNYRKQMRF